MARLKAKDHISDKQASVLKQCPEGEFTCSVFATNEMDSLYSLLNKGYLNRWRCIDPGSRRVKFRLTEKGALKIKELIGATPL